LFPRIDCVILCYENMKAVESESSTPPEIIKTLEILAPKGAVLEQKVAAMKIAAELYEAQTEGGFGRGDNKKASTTG